MGKDLYRSIFIILLFIAGGVLLLSRTSSELSPEITKIKTLTNVSESSEELLRLLERVGPMEAQEQMLRSGMPFDGETHLLIHTVGDYIYDKYGKDGLPYCKDYFLSACYHGFILNILGDHGLEGMGEVMERCNDAPPGVSSQCAHGAGHGFVAWHDYDLKKALEMCDEVGEITENFGYFNCYDGVFMENMWGVHNGVPSEKRWVDENDIYYPCNDPRIPEKYLGGCWANQASLIFQYMKGDFKKTAEACDAVVDESYRNTCYNNFARQVHPATKGSPKKVFELCSFATGQERQDECVLTNMGSFWSVGDRESPYQICEMLEGNPRNDCFIRLRGMIEFYYGTDNDKMRVYCDKIKDNPHKQRCLEQ